jgi:MFS family permease
MCLVGLVAAPYYVVEQSITQRLIPENLRGQIFGIRGALNVAGYPLGGLVGGVFASVLGVSFAFSIAMVLCLVMGTACLASPITREMRRTKAEREDGSSHQQQ